MIELANSWWWLLVVAQAVAFVLGFLKYIGFLAKVKTLESEEIGPFVYVCKDFLSPLGQVRLIREALVEAIYSKNPDVESFAYYKRKGMGVYYDNPSYTKPEHCRATFGLCFTEEEAAKLTFPENFRVQNIPKLKVKTWRHPIRFQGAAAYAIGALRFYDFFKENYTLHSNPSKGSGIQRLHSGVLELFDETSIIYAIPLQDAQATSLFHLSNTKHTQHSPLPIKEGEGRRGEGKPATEEEGEEEEGKRGEEREERKEGLKKRHVSKSK